MRFARPSGSRFTQGWWFFDPPVWMCAHSQVTDITLSLPINHSGTVSAYQVTMTTDQLETIPDFTEEEEEEMRGTVYDLTDAPGA